jgi:hypothetical protein
MFQGRCDIIRGAVGGARARRLLDDRARSLYQGDIGIRRDNAVRRVYCTSRVCIYGEG